MENIDPSNLPDFQIPQGFFEKLYEFTGSSTESSKGFLLVYPDQHGRPVVYSRSGSQITEMGIRKSMEQYLTEIEEVDNSFGQND